MILLALLFAPWLQTPPTPQAIDWTITGEAAGDFQIEGSGRATDPAGATVVLTSTAAASDAVAFATSKIPANSFRMRTVTVSAELQTLGVGGGASLWMRVDRDAVSLISDNGGGQASRGDSEWTPRSLALPVPAEATAVTFGIRLRGSGTASARKLRIDVSGPPSAGASLSAAAQEVLEAAIAAAKSRALRRNEVRWEVVEPEVRLFAAGAEKTADVYPAIRYLLWKLGDGHSSLTQPAQAAAMAGGGSRNPSPEVRPLAGNVGYISVPTYSGTQPAAVSAYATNMHELVGSVVATVTCGWVVDLRANAGGNMWPMLAGLKPFLGAEPLGSFEGGNLPGQPSPPPWVAGRMVNVEPPSTLAALESAWVAVLTGPRTASSGEAVAIAVRGRPHARSFGQPTAGLSTATQSVPLPDRAIINLTVAVDADRTGRRYGGKVDPDERVDTGATMGDTVDPTIAAAIKWLRESTGCGKGVR